jgi:cell division protein FtsW (lipid II flippase)
MFERRLYYHIDWALVAAIFALCGIGVVMIYSTTSDPTRASSHLWVTQLYAIGLGVVAMLVTLSLEYRTFTDKSHFIYIALLVVLVYVLFFGMCRWALGAGFLRRRSTSSRRLAKIGVALSAKFYGRIAERPR